VDSLEIIILDSGSRFINIDMILDLAEICFLKLY